MTPRNDPHARYEELAAGHALHALEPEDEQDFRAHLDGCTRCRADLAEHEAALAQLAYAAPIAEPPPSLLAGIREGLLASGRAASYPEPAAPVHDLARARDARRLRRAGTWVGIAAAVALVASLAVWNSALRADRDQQDAWGEQITQAVAALGDGGTAVSMHGEDGEVVAVAVVHGADMTLVVDGLPVNEDGTSYVLWGEDLDGDKHAVGVFDVDRELDVLDGMRMDDGVRGMARLMVTREQGDAAPPTPTLPVLAVGEV